MYVASHNRTLHEVLFPTPKDIRLAYEGSFDGMTTEPVVAFFARQLLKELRLVGGYNVLYGKVKTEAPRAGGPPARHPRGVGHPGPPRARV